MSGENSASRRMRVDEVTAYSHFIKSLFKDRALIALVGISLAAGILMAGIFPVYQSPDEPAHAAVIEVIALQHRLPKANEKLPTIVMKQVESSHWWSEMRTHNLYRGAGDLKISAAPHPPLYYLLATPVFLLFYKTAYWIFFVRLIGVFLAAVVVFFVYKTAALLFPDDLFVRIAAPLFVALLPQFQFNMGSINNDPLAVALGAVLVYLLARQVDGANTKTAIWTGIVLGAGLLSKTSFLLYIPLVGLFYASLAGTRRSGVADSIRFAAISFGLGAGIGAWWFVRDYLIKEATISLLAGSAGGSGAPGIWRVMIDRLVVTKVFEGFWAFFGWFTVPLRPVVYAALIVVCATAAVGLGKLVFDGAAGRSKQGKNMTFALFAFAFAVAVNYLSVIQFEVATGGGTQGRYMFMTIVPIAILMALGFGAFVPKRYKSVAVRFAAAACLLLFGLSVGAYIMPYYYG